MHRAAGLLQVVQHTWGRRFTVRSFSMHRAVGLLQVGQRTYGRRPAAGRSVHIGP
jgi:hypothetical protein